MGPLELKENLEKKCVGHSRRFLCSISEYFWELIMQKRLNFSHLSKIVSKISDAKQTNRPVLRKIFVGGRGVRFSLQGLSVL